MNTVELRNEYYMDKMKTRLIELAEASEKHQTAKRIKEIASEYKIVGRSKMNKHELVQAINKRVHEIYNEKTLDEIMNEWLSYGGSIQKINREFYLEVMSNEKFQSVYDALEFLELITHNVEVLEFANNYQITVTIGEKVFTLWYHSAEKKVSHLTHGASTYGELFNYLYNEFPKIHRTKNNSKWQYEYEIMTIYANHPEKSLFGMPQLSGNLKWQWYGRESYSITTLLELIQADINK